MKNDIPDNIQQIARLCQQHNGEAWVVGGTVRDIFLNKPSKDWDLEIHNLDGNSLYNILRSIGPCKRVGKSFSVFKLNNNNMEIDVALPLDNGQDNPNLGIKEALRRRDLTINAMAYNLHTHTLYDPFNGQQDIQQKMLRATDPQTFVEDPLRVLRVAQFASRFSFQIADELRNICLQLELSSVPKERILIEMHKMWLRSPKPSVGLQRMKELELFSILPNWEKPTHPAVLLAVDRCQATTFADTAHQLAAFWICALHKTNTQYQQPILNTLKLHSINKINLQHLILAVLSALEYGTKMCTDIEIRRLSDIAPLSFLWRVFSCIYSPEGHPHIGRLKDRIQQLNLWNNTLPQLLKGKELMRMGYIGKDIGLTLKHIREQQILGVIETKEEALTLLQERKKQ